MNKMQKKSVSPEIILNIIAFKEKKTFSITFLTFFYFMEIFNIIIH